MTAQQATDYLASMGVDAEVVETDTEAEETSEATNYNTVITSHPETANDEVLTYSGG